MARLEAVQFPALEFAQLAERVVVQRGDGRQQGGGGDIKLALHFEEGVVEVGMHGDGQVGRDGPGGGGPDQDRHRAAGVFLEQGRELAQGELDRDRGRCVVVVFDLGLGQGGAAGDAPVDRALLAVDVAFPDEGVEEADHRGLVLVIEGGVRPLPVAEDAQALEVGALGIEELFGVQAAFLPDLELGHALLARAELLVDLVLDGQAVAVPAGDVGAVKTRHGPALDHEVLEDLVQCRAQVDVAVGVGRTVVQDVGLAAGAAFQDALVDAGILPFFQHLGLFLAELGLHGKVGARQVQRIFPLQFFVRHDLGSGLV